jgi:carboxymethylenebutenolidase
VERWSEIMKVLWIALPSLLLAGCAPEDEAPLPASRETQDFVERTAAEHANDAPTPSPGAEIAPVGGVIEQEIAYGESGDHNLTGYLVMPEDAIPPLPGILVIHEWWGLNDNIRAASRRLAAEGYVVLAVDLYAGAVAETPDAAESLMTNVMSSPETALANLRQGYEYLDRYAFASRIASLGWCLGGGWSLQTALSLPGELDAMVMYYGQLVTDESRLATLDMPILGFFAENDQSIPVGEVREFRATLNRLGKDSEIRVYSDVGHAFANPSGGSYDAESAEDAWTRTIAFLDEQLK